MQEKEAKLFRTITSPWRYALLDAIAKVQHEIFCISPFVTKDVIESIEETLLSLSSAGEQKLTIRLLTRIRAEDFLNGASQLEALEYFLEWSMRKYNWHIELRANDELHAKVWLFDNQLAFIGSGNATYSGLERNIEYGIAIAEPNLIAQIYRDWSSIWERSPHISMEQLQIIRNRTEQERDDSAIQKIKQDLSRRREELIKNSQLPDRLGISDHPSLKSKANPSDVHIVKQPELTLGSTDSLTQSTREDCVAASTFSQASEQTQTQQHSAMLAIDTIKVDAHELWQALCWLHPPLELPEDAKHLDNFHVSFVWTLRTGTLSCMLFGSKRQSRSLISTIGSSSRQYCTITINQRGFYKLQEMLRNVVELDEATMHQYFVQLTLKEVEHQLEVSLSGNSKKESLYLDAIYGRSPIHWSLKEKRLMHVLVEHKNFINALSSLERQWQIIQREQSDSLPSIFGFSEDMQVRFSPLKFWIDPPNKEISISASIPKYHVIKDHLNYRYQEADLFFISYSDLWLALQGSLNKAHLWRVFVDRDSEARQVPRGDAFIYEYQIILIPETPPARAKNSSKYFSQWSHMFLKNRNYLY